jgi:hypothetical protein
MINGKERRGEGGTQSLYTVKGVARQEHWTLRPPFRLSLCQHRRCSTSKYQGTLTPRASIPRMKHRAVASSKTGHHTDTWVQHQNQTRPHGHAGPQKVAPKSSLVVFAHSYQAGQGAG